LPFLLIFLIDDLLVADTAEGESFRSLSR